MLSTALTTAASALTTLATAGGQQQDQSIWQSMFDFQVPPAEKVIRTVAIYLVIAVLIRLAGKRTLAQLNSFDLVVMLLLSNVVQNAIIGEDNSLVGGVVGAVVLIALNWGLDRLAFLVPTIDRIAHGKDAVLVTDGTPDTDQLRKSGITEEELLSAIRHQGADQVSEVKQATLENNGQITMELKRDEQSANRGELDDAVATLTRHLDERLAALEARLAAR